MDAKKLKQILDEHKKWICSNCEEGKRADLREANLRGADLRGADLRGADLRWADLQKANLRGADLQEANLRWADLQKADLRGADLRGADLRGADLRGADLQEANLRGADLDLSCWPLSCGGTAAKISHRVTLQLIYHAFNQDHEDAKLRKALEPLRKYAEEFRTLRTDAPELRK